jgi:hypothetical protein
MMGRLNHEQEQFFYSFRLDEAVPEDHSVREIAAVVDLSWVHSELAPYHPGYRSLLVGVGHNQARIHRKALSANQTSRNTCGACWHRLG